MPSSNILKFSKRPRAIFFAGKEVPRSFCLAEIEAIRTEGYERGFKEASAAYEQKLEELRTEVVEVQRKTLDALERQHETLAAQVSHALPGLVMEAIRRTMTIVKIDQETVTGIVEDLLSQTNPGAGALEVILCQHDLTLFEGNEERLAEKHPGIRFTADPDMQPGDCMVRSRFGIADGRVATKLQNIEALLQ